MGEKREASVSPVQRGCGGGGLTSYLHIAVGTPSEGFLGWVEEKVRRRVTLRGGKMNGVRRLFSLVYTSLTEVICCTIRWQQLSSRSSASLRRKVPPQPV